jgi:hypothetical protein
MDPPIVPVNSKDGEFPARIPQESPKKFKESGNPI